MQFLVSFLVALGVGTWFYARLYRSTGGNQRNAMIGSAVIGLFAFLVIFYLASRFLSS